MGVSIMKIFATDILLNIMAVTSNTVPRTRKGNAELSLMHVPMTVLILQAHFKVRECALMMCMVLGAISDDIITGTTDHISHSMKVQANSVCIHYISLLRDMSDYDRDSDDNSDLEHTIEYGSKMYPPPMLPPSPSPLPQLSHHHDLCQSLSCKIGSSKIIRHDLPS